MIELDGRLGPAAGVGEASPRTRSTSRSIARPSGSRPCPPRCRGRRRRRTPPRRAPAGPATAPGAASRPMSRRRRATGRRRSPRGSAAGEPARAGRRVPGRGGRCSRMGRPVRGPRHRGGRADRPAAGRMDRDDGRHRRSDQWRDVRPSPPWAGRAGRAQPGPQTRRHGSARGGWTPPRPSAVRPDDVRAVPRPGDRAPTATVSASRQPPRLRIHSSPPCRSPS